MCLVYEIEAKNQIKDHIFTVFCPLKIFSQGFFLHNLVLGTLGTHKQYLQVFLSPEVL